MISFQDEDSGTFESDASARHYGLLRTFFPRKDGHYLVYLGPHWYVHLTGLLIYTLALLLFNLYATVNLTLFWKAGIASVHVCSVATFLAIGLVNPGLEAEQEVDLPFAADRYCRTCRLVRRRGTVHCRDCDVCIIEYDHHCPWTGKCVGGKNIGWFYAFLSSMAAAFLVGVLGVVVLGSKPL